MTTEKEIPGGTAVFREPSELRGRDRDLIRAVAMAAGPALEKVPEEVREKPETESDEDFEKRQNEAMAKVQFTWQEALSMLDLRRATVVATLESWSLDRPLPTMDDIGDLPADLHDALVDAVGGMALSGENFGVQPPGENPTGDSRSSSTPSKDSQLSTPTLESSPDTAPTAGDVSSPA